MKKSFLLAHQHLITTAAPLTVLESEGWCFVMTTGYMCPFMQGGICVVYADRPKICRDFGKFDNMPCIYLTKKGKERTPEDSARVKADYAEKRLKLQMIAKGVK